MGRQSPFFQQMYREKSLKCVIIILKERQMKEMSDSFLFFPSVLQNIIEQLKESGGISVHEGRTKAWAPVMWFFQMAMHQELSLISSWYTHMGRGLLKHINPELHSQVPLKTFTERKKKKKKKKPCPEATLTTCRIDDSICEKTIARSKELCKISIPDLPFGRMRSCVLQTKDKKDHPDWCQQQVWKPDSVIDRVGSVSLTKVVYISATAELMRKSTQKV